MKGRAGAVGSESEEQSFAMRIKMESSYISAKRELDFEIVKKKKSDETLACVNGTSNGTHKN